MRYANSRRAPGIKCGEFCRTLYIAGHSVQHRAPLARALDCGWGVWRVEWADKFDAWAGHACCHWDARTQAMEARWPELRVGAQAVRS